LTHLRVILFLIIRATHFALTNTTF
jgi:hypothetical protein